MILLKWCLIFVISLHVDSKHIYDWHFLVSVDKKFSYVRSSLLTLLTLHYVCHNVITIFAAVSNSE